MKSGVRTYSIAYILGVASTYIFTIPYIASLITTPPLIFISYLTRRERVLFLIITHTLFILIGNTSVNLEFKRTLPDKISSYYQSTTDKIKNNVIKELATHITSQQELSTIVALTLGEKNLMDKSLKEAYSKGGAMHILALSGLHVGIIFLMVTNTLSVFTFIPKGKMITKILSVIIILLYAILTGGSPSVLRASLMIFTYKIAEVSFRDVSKWDCIAISALLICIISPQDLFSIGFQLSFAAVTGITLLFPICKSAWQVAEHYLQNIPVIIKFGIKKLWETLSISICCQITTLPLVLFYFGTSPIYYLISNIVAIPLATLILHLLPITLILTYTHILSEISYSILEYLAFLMNWCIKEISI